MLEDIKKNIDKLIALFEGATAENESLREALEKSEAANKTAKQRITDLEKQLDDLRLSQAFAATSDEDGQAKAKLDKLIREIDRCIGLLEK